jgi:hypothetical protein
VHLVLPLLLRYRTRRWLTAGITQVEAANVETLVDLYHQFQQGKVRLLLAFRHPEVDDPLSCLYVLSRLMPRVARQQGIELPPPLHSHFLYDRGMPLWGGAWLGWLLSRLGGIPIHRGRRLDLTALRTVRELLTNGTFPLAIAPEGANNGHSERVSPLELGMAQLGFWCVEDLRKAGRSESVLVVPIGVRYRFRTPPWQQLDRLLDRLEADCGLSPPPVDLAAEVEHIGPSYARRLQRLGDRLLSEMEQFYHRFYDSPSPQLATAFPERNLGERLQALLDTSLRVAEEHFGLPSQGSTSERCRRIEEAGWMAIYREDLPPLDTLPPLERHLADWVAEAADFHMRHMRLVESFVAVSDTYVCEQPTIERLVEVTLILFDCVSRIQGRRMPKRPQLGKRWVQVTVGEPISISDRWPDYAQSRQSAKRAIQALTQELHSALERAIADDVRQI